MPPAARITDMHVCPMVTPGVPPIPHVGGPILPPGVPTVLIGFLPAATVTNMATCVGPPDIIAKGSAGVFINFLPAARMGDTCAHGGAIVLGEPTVMIGEIGSPSPGGGGAGGIAAGLAAAGLSNPSKSGSYSAALGAGGTKGTGPDGPADLQPLSPSEIQLVSNVCESNGITDPAKVESYCDACDPPVTEKTLQPGDTIDVWVRDGGQPGMFSTPPGTDPETVGIITAGRHLEQYVVTEPITVVQSTAKDFPTGLVPGVGGKGGGTQYMMPPSWKGATKKL